LKEIVPQTAIFTALTTPSCQKNRLKVAKVMDTMKKDRPELAEKVVPIFVSIDPARDSLMALKAYAKDFHPDYIFLTGAPEQVRRMAKSYRVYFSKAEESEDGEDYLVDHSIVVYLHGPGPDGGDSHAADYAEVADCFTQSMRPSDIVEKLIERMTAKPKIMT
jgi:protein SCO1